MSLGTMIFFEGGNVTVAGSVGAALARLEESEGDWVGFEQYGPDATLAVVDRRHVRAVVARAPRSQRPKAPQQMELVGLAAAIHEAVLMLEAKGVEA